MRLKLDSRTVPYRRTIPKKNTSSTCVVKLVNSLLFNSEEVPGIWKSFRRRRILLLRKIHSTTLTFSSHSRLTSWFLSRITSKVHVPVVNCALASSESSKCNAKSRGRSRTGNECNLPAKCWEFPVKVGIKKSGSSWIKAPLGWFGTFTQKKRNRHSNDTNSSETT